MTPPTRETSTRIARDVLLLLALCVPLFLVGLGGYDLDMRGEPREGITARETIHGDALLPLLNGERLPEKPLVFPWLVSLGMRAFGERSEWAVRLPSALAAVGLVFVVLALGRRLLGPRGGPLAAGVCASTFLVVSLARRGRVDMTLTFFVCLALLQFVAMFQAHEADAAARPSRGRLLVFWLAVAAATLTKGPLGFILPTLAIVPFLLVRRRPKFAAALVGTPAVAAFVLLVGGWYAYGLATGGAAFGFRTFLMENVLMFFGAPDGGGHRHGPTYFVPLYFVFGAPWSALLPAATWLVVRRARGGWDRESMLLPLCWFAGMFVLFSAGQGKRGDYLLPLLPAASLVVAAALVASATTADVLAKRAFAASAWLLAALGVVAATAAAALVWAPGVALPRIVAERRESASGRAMLSVVEEHPVVAAALLAAVVAISVAPAVGLAARRPGLGVGVAATAMAVAVPVGLATFMPAYRAHDTLRPFAEEMLRATGPEATIRGLDNFEAQVFFYADRSVPSLGGAAGDAAARGRAFDDYLDAPGPAWVFASGKSFDALTPDRRARLEVELASRREDVDGRGQSLLLRRRAP